MYVYAKIPRKTSIYYKQTTTAYKSRNRTYPTSAEIFKSLHPQIEGSERLHQSAHLYIHSSLVSKF